MRRHPHDGNVSIACIHNTFYPFHNLLAGPSADIG
jgi:hypothetical protein